MTCIEADVKYTKLELLSNRKCWNEAMTDAGCLSLLSAILHLQIFSYRRCSFRRAASPPKYLLCMLVSHSS